MFSGKKLAVATTATAAIALVALLMATLAAPAAATTTLGVKGQNQASAKFKIPSMEDIYKGRIISDYFEMKFADLEGNVLKNLVNWTVTPRNLGVAVNIHTAHIIEFVDSNGNGIPDPESSEIKNDIKLSEITWRLDGIENNTGDEIWIKLVGNSPAIQLELYIHIYFKDTNVTGPGGAFSAVVPGLKAVKIDLVVKHYDWVDNSGNSKLALVILLKCEPVEAQYEYRFRLANGSTFSDMDNVSGLVPKVSEDESEIGLVTADNAQEIKATFRWFNYAVKSNASGESVINVTSGFNVTDGWVALYLCVDYFGSNEVSFDPYFAVLSTGGEVPPEAVLAFQYYYIVTLASSQGANNLMLIGAAGVVVIAGVAIMFYIRRR